MTRWRQRRPSSRSKASELRSGGTEPPHLHHVARRGRGHLAAPRRDRRHVDHGRRGHGTDTGHRHPQGRSGAPPRHPEPVPRRGRPHRLRRRPNRPRCRGPASRPAGQHPGRLLRTWPGPCPAVDCAATTWAALRDKPDQFREVARGAPSPGRSTGSTLSCSTPWHVAPRRRPGRGVAGLRAAARDRPRRRRRAGGCALGREGEGGQPLQRGYGFHPPLCFHDAIGEALAGILLPASAAAKSSADQLAVVDDAVVSLPPPGRCATTPASAYLNIDAATITNLA